MFLPMFDMAGSVERSWILDPGSWILIRNHVRETPLEPSSFLSRIAGAPVLLKIEAFQFTGSFKLRGAVNALMKLSAGERSQGIVAASTGNHALALVHASRVTGVARHHPHDLDRLGVIGSIPVGQKAAIEQFEALLADLKKSSGLQMDPHESDPALRLAVVESKDLPALSAVLQRHLGEAFIPAGTSAFFKNLLDSFVRSIGGVRREQTLYRKSFESGTTLYCAIWPWASRPTRVSIRVGLHDSDSGRRQKIQEMLSGSRR